MKFKNTCLALLCFSAFISCKKESESDKLFPKSSSTSSSENANQASTVDFGILTPQYNSDGAIASAKNLGVSLFRMSLLSNDANPPLWDYSKYYNAGLNVQLVLKWGNTIPRPFPSDLTLYRSNLNSIFTSLKNINQLPKIVIIENEPTNTLFYKIPNNDMTPYINELNVAIEVAHSFGVKVADGCLHPQALMYFTYKDYQSRGLTDSANYVYKYLSSGAITYDKGKNPDFSIYLSRVTQLLNAYKTMNLDYCNFHFYTSANFENVDPDLKPMINYYTKTTGKQIIANEFGVKSVLGDGISDNTIMQNVMARIKASGLLMAIYYNATGVSVSPLTNSTGLVLPLGSTFKSLLTP